MKTYLFIYRVTARVGSGPASYCSVVAYGADRRSAEAVAINVVHQAGLHIQSTDTATEADWLDESSDLGYLEDLSRYGVALRLLDDRHVA
jgi:hypothetical protein